MLVQDICKAVERTAPLSHAAPWDNSGVQVACTREDASCIAVCLDPTPQAVHEALSLGAQCVVSHHPLLLQGRLPNRLDAFHTVLRELFTADALLYAAHTTLDSNPHGPVSWLARELRLRDARVLEVTSALPDGGEAGFGLVGDLPETVSLDGLLALLAPHISLEVATLCGPYVTRISRVAYCTGSGASLAELAAQAGADIFITGDVKHHAAIDTTVAMLDVGQHSLEEEMMRRFALQLATELPQVSVRFVASASPLRPAPTVGILH